MSGNLRDFLSSLPIRGSTCYLFYSGCMNGRCVYELCLFCELITRDRKRASRWRGGGEERGQRTMRIHTWTRGHTNIRHCFSRNRTWNESQEREKDHTIAHECLLCVDDGVCEGE